MDTPAVAANGCLPPLGRHDALLVVDVQNDFLAGGALPVPGGEQVIPVLNGWLERFASAHLPVYAARDWHPREHLSFQRLGGPWPPHCVAGTRGAAFPPQLNLPADVVVIAKGTAPAQRGYSAFEASDLAKRLQRQAVQRVFVGGLATEYAVLHTVSDALELGFDVVLLADAVRAIDLDEGDGDGEAALTKMRRLGAALLAGTPAAEGHPS